MPSFARLTLMAFFSSSHFWINLAHSFLKCVLNLGQLFILRKKDAHANFVRSDALVTIFMHGSSEVTLQKKERNATRRTFFYAFCLWNFLRNKKWKLLPLIHLAASQCVLLLLLYIILLFSIIVCCRTKKTKFYFWKLFNKQFCILNALFILYFCCAYFFKRANMKSKRRYVTIFNYF